MSVLVCTRNHSEAKGNSSSHHESFEFLGFVVPLYYDSTYKNSAMWLSHAELRNVSQCRNESMTMMTCNTGIVNLRALGVAKILVEIRISDLAAC